MIAFLLAYGHTLTRAAVLVIGGLLILAALLVVLDHTGGMPEKPEE